MPNTIYRAYTAYLYSLASYVPKHIIVHALFPIIRVLSELNALRKILRVQSWHKFAWIVAIEVRFFVRTRQTVTVDHERDVDDTNDVLCMYTVW